MLESINNILVKIDDIVWGVPLMVLILTGGIWLTVRMGVLQIRKLPLALNWMVNTEAVTGDVVSRIFCIYYNSRMGLLFRKMS